MKDIDPIDHEPPVATALPREDLGASGGSTKAASSSDVSVVRKSAASPQLDKPLCRSFASLGIKPFNTNPQGVKHVRDR